MANGRDEHGVALPSAVVLLTIVAVAMAGLAFLATDDATDAQARTVAGQSRRSDRPQPAGPDAQPSTGPGTGAEAPARPKRRVPPLVRSEVFVEVYNNTGIQDLAASVAVRAADAGWDTVGTDNWLGTIPATAVYYPPRLERAARALARDLDIAKTAPAIEPMKLDRLTVILTLDFV